MKTIDLEQVERRGEFALGYGFSDQCFLAHRSDLAKPIYRDRCPASLRYSLSAIARFFEQRLDSYMRRHRLLHATHLASSYIHPDNEGDSYPALTRTEKVRRIRNWFVLKIANQWGGKNPCYRINP